LLESEVHNDRMQLEFIKAERSRVVSEASQSNLRELEDRKLRHLQLRQEIKMLKEFELEIPKLKELERNLQERIDTTRQVTKESWVDNELDLT
jgi:hypothetical protein